MRSRNDISFQERAAMIPCAFIRGCSRILLARGEIRKVFRNGRHAAEKLYPVVLLFLFIPFLAQSQPLIIDTSAYRGKIKVACVGSSFFSVEDTIKKRSKSYPAFLQQILGDKFMVKDFGAEDVTVLRKGHHPYRDTKAYAEAFDFNPDIVVFNIGVNDTGPKDWEIFRDEFAGDYLDMIEEFRNLKSKPKIWICRMTPVFSQYPSFKYLVRDSYREIQKAIERVAGVSGSTLIDLHSPLYDRPDLFPDFMHPDIAGREIIAGIVYSELTGNYGGLSIPQIFGSHMVLQRNRDIVFRGKANAGQKIEITFEKDMISATADVHGNWHVVFPPKRAGGPYTITIRADTQKVTLSDVLVGEVWLCSGQSNMDFKLSYSFDAEKAITEAAHDNMRLMSLKTADRTIRGSWSYELLSQINQHEIRVSGWKVCSPVSAKDFSAVAYYFGAMLLRELNVPVGLIDNSKGGSPAEAWTGRRIMEFHPVLVDFFDDWRNNDRIQKWCRDRAVVNCSNAENPLQRHPFEPAYLFETLIQPIAGFPVKGVIWYQGEANAHNVELHEVIFPELVKSWRNAFDDNLPFYYVQLSGFSRAGWPLFRDSQRRLMGKVSGTGMVVSSDVGDSLDIHPRRKRQVGERLALWALAKEYGKNIEYSGPLYQSVVFEGRKAIVTFSHASGMKSADGKRLRSFEIAGADKIFKPARAEVEGNKIELISEGVKKPEFVRYGWQPYSEGNLVNGAGLPASTFSSEYGN